MAVYLILNTINIIVRSTRYREIYLILGKSNISLAILRVRPNIRITGYSL